jgi:hypothetical protein
MCEAPQERRCLKCEEAIPTQRRKDAKYCSSKCRTEASAKRHYHRHLGKYATKRAQENSNASKRILYRARSRALKNGIPFTLVESDIVIPDVCPVLGIPLVKHQGKKGYHPDSPSLDRIKPKLGYTQGNVRVISARANLLKNDASVKELEMVVNDLKNLEQTQCASLSTSKPMAS